MKDCIFCKIIGGQIPGQKLLETDTVIAIMDINPIAHGHALVIPKPHHETLAQVPDDLAQQTMVAIKTVAQAIVAVTKAEGFNLLQNNGRCSGQIVPHAHFHIIPRHSGDGIHFHWSPQKYEEGKMEALAEAIRAQLKSSMAKS